MNRETWDVDLVGELKKLADSYQPNRAALANLRRGLDAPLDVTLGRLGWLFRRVPDGALDDAVLAAGLFAWTKCEGSSDQGVDLGAAFGSGLTLEEKQRREKRLIDLLDTDKDDLPYKIRQALTLIGRNGVPLNWVLFIKHLCGWNHPNRWVQKVWARGFWAAVTEEEVEPTDLLTPTTTE